MARLSSLVIEFSEADFQTQVVQLAENLGWQWMHIGRVGKYVANGAKGTLGKGWPDLILCRRGRLIAAELKRDKEMLKPAQQVVLGHLRDAGVEVHVWRPGNLAEIAEVLT